MIGFLREHHAPVLPPLPPRSACEGGRTSAAHLRHPIGESWVGGLTVEAYTWRESAPSLRVRCVCGWVGEVRVRTVEEAEDEDRTPRCPVRGTCRDHRGPVVEQEAPALPPAEKTRSRPRRSDGPAYARILEAYDRISPGWPGTRATLHLAVVSAAGFPVPEGYTGANSFVREALRARREGRL